MPKALLCMLLRPLYLLRSVALFSPETSVLIQSSLYWNSKPRNLSGDSKNAFLHCGDGLAFVETYSTASTKSTRLPLSLLLVRSITAECPA